MRVRVTVNDTISSIDSDTAIAINNHIDTANDMVLQFLIIPLVDPVVIDRNRRNRPLFPSRSRSICRRQMHSKVAMFSMTTTMPITIRTAI